MEGGMESFLEEEGESTWVELVESKIGEEDVGLAIGKESTSKLKLSSLRSCCTSRVMLFVWVGLIGLLLSVPWDLVAMRFTGLGSRQGEVPVNSAHDMMSAVAGEGEEDNTVRTDVLWMAPFLSGGGYCTEAISYALALSRHGGKGRLQIRQHGDAFDRRFWEGLPEGEREVLQGLFGNEVEVEKSVVVCHSEPGAWYPALYQTAPCPPRGYGKARYVIGRTMFETDRVTTQHVERCNRMDEVWVPTEFHIRTFSASGVTPSKLVKIIQAVDTAIFNPHTTKSIPIPASHPLFPSPFPPPSPLVVDKQPMSSFSFLSIFKWETRKGWDLLLTAFLSRFSANDDVTLYLLTNAYHTDTDFIPKMQRFVATCRLQEPPQGWAHVRVIRDHVPQADLAGLYKSVDAFVLPSRGEGWGRPIVEAMAMGLPVIATNWSGMTEYMRNENSYPIALERLEEVVEGPFKGHRWALPCVKHLGELMQHVFTNRKEAQSKGIVARRDMETKYSPEVVGRKVIARLNCIDAQFV